MNPKLRRQWHGYVGAFIAPSVLFFAPTGALQLFSLHEADGGYVPPPVIERLGRLQKIRFFGLESIMGRLQPKCDLPPRHSMLPAPSN